MIRYHLLGIRYCLKLAMFTSHNSCTHFDLLHRYVLYIYNNKFIIYIYIYICVCVFPLLMLCISVYILYAHMHCNERKHNLYVCMYYALYIQHSTCTHSMYIHISQIQCNSLAKILFTPNVSTADCCLLQWYGIQNVSVPFMCVVTGDDEMMCE